MTDWESLTPALVAAAAVLVVAGAGGLATDLGPWYRSLKQPRFKPPDWLFGPAWTVIFILTATGGVMAWHRAPDYVSRVSLLLLFALNGVLNIAWSVLYFRFKRPDWALIEVAFLWLSIAALIVFIARFSTQGSWLLAPYLIWVAYAGSLNVATVRLNGPFGSQ
jgi:translocator protein